MEEPDSPIRQMSELNEAAMAALEEAAASPGASPTGTRTPKI